MGLPLDILNWTEGQPIPEEMSLRTPRAWVAEYCTLHGITMEKAQQRSVLAAISARLNPVSLATHVHLVTDGHMVPGRARTGKQPSWGGDVEPVTETAVVPYAPAAALEPLRVLASKDGFVYPTSGPAINDAIAVFDGAPKRLQRAAVDGITAMAAETELERVQRQNAEKLVQIHEATIEDLRADKRAWQEVVHKSGRSGGNQVTRT